MRRSATSAGSLGGESSSTPSANTPKCAWHRRPHARGRQLERQLVALDDQVVVAERLPLLESHQAAESRISSATEDGERSVTSIGVVAGELAHPRQLAARVVARAALHRLHVARQQLLEAERLARGDRHAGGVRATHLLAARPRRSSARRARRCARTAPRAASSSAASSVGWRSSSLHSCDWRAAAAARRPRSSSSARTMRRQSAASMPSAAHGATLGEPAVKRGRAVALQICHQTFARAPAPAPGAGPDRPAPRAGTGPCRRRRSAAGARRAGRRSRRVRAWRTRRR